MKVGSRRMSYGRNRVPSGELNCYFEGGDAHPWILERRNGLARGIYNHVKGDDPFSGKQVLAEVQWPLTALISE